MSVAVLAARRSAVCPSGGGFAALCIEDLAAPVIAAALADAGLTVDAVDEVILGNALGAGGNPARRVALAAGLPDRVAGMSVDRQCLSGLDALRIGAAMIAAGQARIVLAGGVESHSTRPIRSHRADGRVYEQAPFTPWPARDPDMAVAAAALAARLGVSRQAADSYAIESHQKARRAADRLAHEIVPVAGVTTDSFTRALGPALAARARIVSGPITAANMAVSADAAAVCVLAAPDFGGPALARVVASATLGATPEEPGLAALPAIESVLEAAALDADALASVDLMEAFAVQALATIAAAGLDPSRVNPVGGALARGHPIGASGAIGAVRAVREAAARQGPTLAAIPAAGGIGSAMLFTPG